MSDEKKPSSHNIGMYRVQLLGKDRVAMHWHMHHDGARHWRSWKKLGEPMPVAIALGGRACCRTRRPRRCLPGSASC
jgi:4-hydroxy-3-polyprenylbenzoate decarboxylase